MPSSSTEKMKVQCPKCQKMLMVPVSASGKGARCPGCSQTFTIPEVFQLEASAPDPLASGFPSSPNLGSPNLGSTGLGSSNFSNNDPLFGDLSSIERAAPAMPTMAGPSIPVQNFGGGSESQDKKLAYDLLAKARADQAAKASSNDGGAFSLEKKGVDKGVVGGLVMMLIAIVWFVGGLFAGFIFFYPPILFLIGLFGFIKGLISGNITGR